MKLYIPGGPPALEAPRSYPSKPITGSYEGHTTVTGTPSPDNPAALTPLRVPAVTGAAKQVGELWSLPDGTADRYDGENGILVRRIKKLICNGTENWILESRGVRDKTISIALILAESKGHQVFISCVSTHFPDNQNLPDSACMAIWTLQNTSIHIILEVPLALLTSPTVDAAKAWLAAQKAAGTPVTILYEMGQPIVERITYTGPIPTRATDLLAPSWTGKTTVTGTSSPDNPATITGVPFRATATGPDGQSRSMDLGITGYRLANGTADSYDGRTGALVRRVARIILGDTSAYATPNRDDSAIDNVCIYLGIGNGYIPTPKNVTAISTHFVNRNVYSGGGEGIFPANSKPPYYVAVYLLKSRLKAYGLVDGDKDSYLIAANAWFKAQADAGTPVVVYYELEQPIAYNRKADITAFEGQTTVTGADAVEVIEGRVLRVADCMPFELVRSNPNLFDNGDFRFPINQRGAFNYIANSNYSIDRWFLWRLDHKGIGSIRLDKNKGITLLCSPGNQVIVEQKVDTLIPNMVYTFAVLCIVNRGSLKLHAFLDDSDLSGFYSTPNITKSGLYFVTGTKKTNAIATLRFFTDTDSNCNITVVAAKLEEGTEQTLARKVGDQWVLNDPPPNYQQEFAKCQQYYISQIGTLCNGYITGAEAQVFVPTPVTMRANPIAEIVFADNIVSPDGVWNVLAITNTVAYKNGVKLNITTNRPSNSARTVCTTASSSFSFSAEL